MFRRNPNCLFNVVHTTDVFIYMLLSNVYFLGTVLVVLAGVSVNA